VKILLWSLQILLGVAFLSAGITVAIQPLATLAPSFPWVLDVPEWLVRFIGVAEILGGIGLVAPSLTRIRPQLTVLAGLGLSLVTLLAALFHLMRGEFPAMVAPLVLLVLVAGVTYGRWRLAPITPR
jgi:putative oxidoreductase